MRRARAPSPGCSGPPGSARLAVTLVEVLVAGAICTVLAVPAIGLLVGSRQGIAGSFNETVARNLAAEALEWGATLPTDGLKGPLVVEETPVGTVPQARLADGHSLANPAYVYDSYTYPPSYNRFYRRLEVTDASPSDSVPLLKLTATVVWAEPGSPNDRIRTVQLWRLIGP